MATDEASIVFVVWSLWIADTLLFIRDNIMFLELEFKYWEDNHKVNFVKDGIQYSMFRYNCEEDGPRPESYFEDFTVFTYKHIEL